MVRDVTAGTSFDLGQVQIAPGLEISGTGTKLFTEYFDWNNTNTRCGDEPHSRISIYAPTTIYNGKVKTAPYLGLTVSSDCPGTSKIMVKGNQVVQEYGIGNSPGGQLINQANGLCADVMNGSSEVGAQLIQYACTNASNQVFVFASDETLHTQTHCLDAGSSPPDGAPLVLAECNNGSPTQHWGLHPYGIESSGGLTIGTRELFNKQRSTSNREKN
ncbi:ricin-type beta-trefoil lectin domain protein [Paenibacillus tritici]|uniref:RICIN domain-containing protein n=1 Tax=Paenibacillus tritici TaxID=1873425 RepID=UPI001BADE08C|nr:RICIN domain-containing protein [Paenibacillus tritici]QUL53250.1 ricin-type beta-trefoil lectin domain protein [Paenibacillus tritici]